MLFKDLTDKDREEVIEGFKGISKLPNKQKTEAMAELGYAWGVKRRTIYNWKKRLLGKKKKLKVEAKSTLYDADGNVKLQWVKEASKDQNKLEAFRDAVDDIVEGYEYPSLLVDRVDTVDGLTTYVSNDLHLGGLSWGEETMDRDWDTDKGFEVFRKAIDDLVDRAPATKECIVVDLGDLMEVDNQSGMTPKSGNILDTDAKYPKILRVAMEAMVYFVDKALLKHDTVYFYNVCGNHDMNTGYAITAFVQAWFRGNDRVIVDDKPTACKYHKYGSTLLGFTHGDGIKMLSAGEVMVMHNEEDWSSTKDRYFLFGHNHKSTVVDTRLCRAESFRNLAPVNAWAAGKGMGRNAGTMTAIVYSKDYGEETRIMYNVRQGE